MKQNNLLWLVIVLLLLIVAVLVVWLVYIMVISPPVATPETPVPTATSPAATAPPSQPTAGPTPTPISGDPAELLGKPDGQDSFDNDNHWALFNNQCFQSEIKEGMFWMRAKGMKGFSCWEVSWPQIANYYVETILEMPQECDQDDRFGLFFRAPDNNRGYLYGLSCGGLYSMTSWDGSSTYVIVDFASSEHILVSPGERNRIGVIADGSNYSLYVNGYFLTQVSDSMFVDEGKIGYFVRAATEDSFTVRYDDLKVWDLSKE